MATCPTFRAPSFVFAFAAIAAAAEPASALDAALAKRCREMAIAAYPTQPAGSATGHAKAQRDLFNECVAKEGNIEPPAGADQQEAPEPVQKSADPGTPPGAAR